MKTVMLNIKLGKGYPVPVMTKLKSYYTIVRHYLTTVAINTPAGYVYIPKEHDAIRRKLEDMRRGWVLRGGRSEDYGMIWLDVELDDAESYKTIMQSVRLSCADMLDNMAADRMKRIRKHSGDANWLDDRRTHKGSDAAYQFIMRWYPMFAKELGQAAVALEGIGTMLTTPGMVGSGLETLRKAADLLRHGDEDTE